MINELNWLDDKTFQIETVRLSIDTTPGPIRRLSEKNNFTLVKTKKYIEEYIGLQGESYPHILELGMFEGGSLVFFDKLFSPKKIVGVDIRKDPIPALEHYIATQAPHICTYYNMSQDDTNLLDQIIEKDFGGKLDLVVDDASHNYKLTKASFVHLFAKLRPGGMYIIEDWAWSLKKGAQEKSHAWYNKPALINLIFDLIAELGRSTVIEDLHATTRMVRIRKSYFSNGESTLLQEPAFRGRTLKLI